ncbi:TonB-dependent receptor [Leadbettera azotonutricia]|uniref:TonB-dependent receptor n=1 Tax=Leadbettera azotonutricia TaxID=150829 RepID=UPI0011D1843C|nr:TonB-dependent receptor [Leadbettera azotonutricia]
MALVLSMGFFAFPVQAQSNDEELDGWEDDFDLVMSSEEGLTISAEGQGQEQNPAAPVQTFYGPHNEVREEQIHDQGSLDLLDTLRDVPGVVISKQNVIGTTTGASLYIRGRGYDHPSLGITTSFDGVPRYGLIYGQSMADSFPVFAADSIELYKSPQPSSFAAGYGLVNVTPKYMAEQGWEARTGFSYGSYQTIGENASFGIRKGRFDVLAAQSWVSSDGHVVHSQAHQQSYYLNAGLWINAYWNLRLLGNFVDAKTEKPPQIGQSKADILPFFTTDTVFSTATLNNEFDNAEGFIKLYYTYTNFRIFDEDARPPRGWSKQLLHAFGGRAKETWHLWEGGEIITGMDLDFSQTANEAHRPGTVDYYHFPGMVLFTPYAAISHFFIVNKFRIIPSAGLRGYIHSVWANAIAPQAGLELGYGNTNLNLSYAFGLLYPSPGNIQNMVSGGDFDVADLKQSKPETVHHYEASLRHDWSNASLGATWFFDDGHDRIIPNPTGAPGNVNETSYFRIQGLEFNGSFTIERDLLFLEKFNVFAGGAWMYKIEAKGEDGKAVSRMPYTPVFSMLAGFKWQFLKRFHLSGDYQFIKELYGDGGTKYAVFTDLSDAVKLDDQHLVNLRLSCEFAYAKWRVDKAEVFAGVNNILNHQYQYYAGYIMPGITYSMGVDFKFK